MSNMFFNPNSIPNGSSVLSRLQNINMNSQNPMGKNPLMQSAPMHQEVGFFDQHKPYHLRGPPVQGQNPIQNEFMRRIRPNAMGHSNGSYENKIVHKSNVKNMPSEMENVYRPPNSNSFHQHQIQKPDNGNAFPHKHLEHYYFTEHGIEIVEDLQISGVLKEADWILYPPASEKTATHLLTGRNHEYKVKSMQDKHPQAFYMDQELQQLLQNRLKAHMFSLDDTNVDKFPSSIGAYCDIIPLESSLSTPRPSISYSLPSQCFKAWSPRMQKFVCLRRVQLDNDRFVIDSDVVYFAKQLFSFEHPNIVSLRDIFLTNEFSDNSLVLVYDYHALTVTMQSLHMTDPTRITSLNEAINQNRNKPHTITKSGSFLLPESTMRNYLVQIVCALQFLHKNTNIPFGLMDPAKILVEDSKRIRLNCFGLMEILSAKKNLSSGLNSRSQEMETDLVNVGNLLLCIGCGSIAVCSSTMKFPALKMLQNAYSSELFGILNKLISSQIKSVNELVLAIAPFSMEFISKQETQNDFLEREITRQMECDRLFRILCKLGSVLERRLNHDPQWSEVDERYMLKMFRDFVFHQSDDLGAPYLDLSHIVSCLNKLEAGSSENICLVSRDNKTCIIVTYKKVLSCLDKSFNQLIELQRNSVEEQNNLAVNPPQVQTIYEMEDMVNLGLEHQPPYEEMSQLSMVGPPPVKQTIISPEEIKNKLSSKS